MSRRHLTVLSLLALLLAALVAASLVTGRIPLPLAEMATDPSDPRWAVLAPPCKASREIPWPTRVSSASRLPPHSGPSSPSGSRLRQDGSSPQRPWRVPWPGPASFWPWPPGEAP